MKRVMRKWEFVIETGNGGRVHPSESRLTTAREYMGIGNEMRELKFGTGNFRFIRVVFKTTQ